MVAVPPTDPATVGANMTFKVALLPGFKVIGVAIPEIEYPVPETETALTVTAAVPVELSVTDCVLVVFSVTVPNATLAALTPSLGVVATGLTCSATLFVAPAELAVIVVVCDVLTALIVALNPAEAAPADTRMEAGTATALLLLVRVTA